MDDIMDLVDNSEIEELIISYKEEITPEKEKKIKEINKKRAYLFKIRYNGIVQKPKKRRNRICSLVIILKIY